MGSSSALLTPAPELNQLPGRLEDPDRGICQGKEPGFEFEIQVGASVPKVQGAGRRSDPKPELLQLPDVVAARQDVGVAGHEEILAIHEQHCRRACVVAIAAGER